MIQIIKKNDSPHEKKIKEHHYGLKTRKSIYKIPAREKNRKRQSTRKYLSPFTEMNFLLISLIILYSFFSSLPLVLSESSSRYEENLIQHQHFAHGKSIPRKPTYAIIAGQTIEPGVPFKVVVTLFLRGMTSQSSSTYGGSHNDMSDHYGYALPSEVHIKILRKGTIIADEKRECQFGTTEIVTIKVPDHLYSAQDENTKYNDYKLVVEGNSYGRLHGSLFFHEKDLRLARKHVKILLQTEREIYTEGQNVQIRVIPFGNDDRLWLEPIDIELINPKGDQIRKWNAKNAASTGGPITINFSLDKPNICGKWTVLASTRGLSGNTHTRGQDFSSLQQHTKTFTVIPYSPVGFEAHISMPFSSILTSSGIIDDGAGTLTGEVTGHLLDTTFDPSDSGFESTGDDFALHSLSSQTPVIGSLSLKAIVIDYTTNGGDIICEQPLFFISKEEEVKSTQSPSNKIEDEVYNLSFNKGNPTLRKFSGRIKWLLSWTSEIPYLCEGRYDPQQNSNEVNEFVLKIEATVTRAINGQKVSAFAHTFVTSQSLNMGFSSASPATFYTDMPFETWIWVQRGIGESLNHLHLEGARIFAELSVQWSDGSRESVLPPFPINRRGILENNRNQWKISLPIVKNDILSLLNKEGNDRTKHLSPASFTLKATFSSGGISRDSELVLLPLDTVSLANSRTTKRYSNLNLQLTTSTKNPKVGESIILHVRSNHFVDDFHCVILSTSSNRVLTTRQVSMGDYLSLKTFDEFITIEMAPSATFVVWHVDDSSGAIVYATLTVHISSRQFTRVRAHSVMDRNGGYSQISVSGDPHSTVALSSKTPRYRSFNERQRSMNRHQGETMLSKMFDPEFSLKKDLVFLTDGTQFQPNINVLPSTNAVDTSLKVRSKMHYCQLIHSNQKKDEEGTSEYVEEERICDSRCDCSDCSDEDKKICQNDNSPERLLSTKIEGIISSPILEELSGYGFWKNVKIPSNGSISVRIPFMGGPHKQLELNSIVVRSRGLATLPSKRVSVGAYFNSKLELPPYVKLNEHISIKLTCINYGSQTIIKSFKFISSGQFYFLTHDGNKMDGERSRSVDVKVEGNGGYSVIQLPIIPRQVGTLTITARIGSSADYLKAQTTVEREGARVERFSVLNVDMTNRPYFIGTIVTTQSNGNAALQRPDPNLFSGSVETEITVTGGVVGPTLSQSDTRSPINITSILGKPQITADEAIFSLTMMLQQKEFSHSKVHIQHHFQNKHKNKRRASSYLNNLSTSVLNMESKQDTGIAISKAYQRLLSYQADDGSFSYTRWENRSSEPSTFLTASALSAIYKLYSFTSGNYHRGQDKHELPLIVDARVIERCLHWIFVHQRDDGSFREDYIYDGIYQRKVPIEFQDVALTAHAVISLSNFIHQDSLWNTSMAMRLGADFLSSRLSKLDQSGTSLDIALVARALQLTRSTTGAETAFEILAKRRQETLDGTFYWGDGNNERRSETSFSSVSNSNLHNPDCDESLSVRSTALALMVYTERGEYMTEPIVRWLNSRRKSGWDSTIDTILATEALVMWTSRFGILGSEKDKEGSEDITSDKKLLELEIQMNNEEDGNSHEQTFVANKNYNSYRSRKNKESKPSTFEHHKIVTVYGDGRMSQKEVIRWSSKPTYTTTGSSQQVQKSGPTIRVEGRGRGVAVVQMKNTFYTTDNDILQNVIHDKDLTSNVKSQASLEAFNLEPEVELRTAYKGVPTTRFWVLSCQKWSCRKDLSVSGPAVLSMTMPSGFILDETQRNELIMSGYNVWTEKNEIIFFFEKLTTEHTCVNFTLLRNFPVANLSPYITIKVYDWYSPERKNVTILYEPKISKTSICDLCGSYECAKKGSNAFCSKNLIDLSSSLIPSSANQNNNSWRRNIDFALCVFILKFISRLLSR